jgi:hypothetical protein
MPDYFYLSATAFPADQSGCYEWLMRRIWRLKYKKKCKMFVLFFITMYYESLGKEEQWVWSLF